MALIELALKHRIDRARAYIVRVLATGVWIPTLQAVQRVSPAIAGLLISEAAAHADPGRNPESSADTFDNP